MSTVNITSKMQVAQLIRNKRNILAIALVIDNNQTGREKSNGLTIKVNKTGWSDSHKAIANMMRVYRETKLTHMPSESGYGMRIRNDDGSVAESFLDRIAIPLPRYWRQLSDVWYDTLTMEVVQ